VRSHPGELLVGDDSGSLVLWHLGTRRPLLTFSHAPPGGPDPADEEAVRRSKLPLQFRNPHVLAAAFLGRDVVASQGRDQRVRFWALESAAPSAPGRRPAMAAVGPLAEIAVPMCGFCPMAFSPLSSLAACDASPSEQRFAMWVPDEHDRRKVTVRTLAVQKGGQTGGPRVRVSDGGWDVPVDTREKLGMPMALTVAVAPSDDTPPSTGEATAMTLAVGFESGHVCTWRVGAAVAVCGDAEETTAIAPRFAVRGFSMIRAMADPITSVAVSACGGTAFLASVTGTLQAYRTGMPAAHSADDDARAPTLLWEDTMPAGSGHIALRPPPHERLLALGAFDGTLRLYDADCGSRVAVVRPEGAATEASVNAVVFDPKTIGRIVAATADRCVSIWEAPSSVVEAA